MNRSSSQIAIALKDIGISVTNQRILVFEALESSSPLTMNELLDKLKGQLDRASLYRIINVFEKHQISQRVNIGWKYKLELSDKFSEHHHHLSCVSCGKIIPINEDSLEMFIERTAELISFQPIKHQVEIEGYCHNCQVRDHKEAT